MLACLLVALAQPSPADTAATLRFIESLRDPATGVYKVTADGKPNLRAVNGGVKTTRALGGTVADVDKLRAFVLSCIDPATGGFAEEPGGKVSVSATAVGVITAVELGIPKDKFRMALDHLKANAKTWEEVRIAGAAVEAWGVKDCPFDLADWDKIADAAGEAAVGGPREGGARDVGGVVAFKLRLGRELPAREAVAGFLQSGQRPDGGWSKPGADDSDLESSYRVMRALHLLKAKPEAAAVRQFITKPIASGKSTITYSAPPPTTTAPKAPPTTSSTTPTAAE